MSNDENETAEKVDDIGPADIQVVPDTTGWDTYVTWICVAPDRVYLHCESCASIDDVPDDVPKYAKFGFIMAVHPALNMNVVVSDMSNAIGNYQDIDQWFATHRMVHLHAVIQRSKNARN